MALDTALYSRLSGNTGVAALVGTRIYPNVATEGSAFPLIVYAIVSAVPSHLLDGTDDGLDDVLVQFDCVAEDYDSAMALTRALRAAMLDVAGGAFKAVPQNVGRMFFDNETKKHVVQLDYACFIAAV